MHTNKYTLDYLEQIDNEFEANEPLKFNSYKNVTILPAKEDFRHPWGKGGVIDSNSKYIPTFEEHVFGGKYNLYEKPHYSTFEQVIYIPVVPKQWGHFIIDVLCRFWWFNDPKYKNFKVAYISKDWSHEGITGNQLEILRLLFGCEIIEKLLYITEATTFNEILVPEPSFTFGGSYHREYKLLIEAIISNCNSHQVNKQRKIYLSRTKIHQYSEVGEEEIESIFENNGYEIIHPEELTFREQINILQESDEIVGISGSNMHNIIFAKDYANVTIINRAGVFNPPQIKINRIKKANVTMIDAYDNDIYLKHPRNYGEGPFLLCVNSNVLRYSEENDLTMIFSTEQLKKIHSKNVTKYRFYYLARFIIRTYRKLFRLVRSSIS
jgi:hypothetical protein